MILLLSGNGLTYSNECNSLSTTESDSENIKKELLLVMKDKLFDSDVLWISNGSPDSISDGTSLENSDGNSEGFTVGAYDCEKPGLIDNTILGVANSSKLGKELRFRVNE